MVNININSSIKIDLTWTEFKKFINGVQKSLFLQFVEDSLKYYLFTKDTDIVYTSEIIKDTSQVHGLSQSQIDQHNQDKSDFENNFKPYCNRPMYEFMQLQDFGDLDPKTRRVIEEWHELQVQSGDNPTVQEFQWDYDVTIQGAIVHANWNNFSTDDTVNAIFIPQNDGLIGSTTSSNSSGDTILDVEKSVINNLIEGDFVIVGSENRKKVINIDEDNFQITLDTSLDSNHNSGENIKIRVLVASNLRLLSSFVNEIAYKPFGSTNFPKGSKLGIEYNHANSPTSDFVIPFGLSMRYGRLIQ